MNSYIHPLKKNISPVHQLAVFSAVLIVALFAVTSNVLASDKYGGGSTSEVSGDDRYSVRTNPDSQYGTVTVTERSTEQTTTYSDWNGDGDYSDPNERMESGPAGGSDRSDGGSVTSLCTGIDIAVTGFRLEREGASAPLSTSGFFSQFGSLAGATAGANLVVGASYVPVVTVQNIGCQSTGYTTPPTSSFSLFSFFNSSPSTVNFRNVTPYGTNGGFPVALAYDLNNDQTYERYEYLNNQGPLASGQSVTLRFPALTATEPGPLRLRAIADPTVGEASNNTCPADASGDWGCVYEVGTGVNNRRTLEATATSPSVTLGSFIINANAGIFGLGTITGASTVNQRDVSALTNEQSMGLYWTGNAINFSTCTGTVTSNTRAALSGFSGQRDTANLSLFALLGLPTVADRVDANIPEPGSDEQVMYTITCGTTSGSTISDSVILFRGEAPVMPETPVIPISPELVPSCSDGQDNDGDGRIDVEDPGCWTDSLDPTTYNPNDDVEDDGIGGGPVQIIVQPPVVRRGGETEVTWNTGGNTGCVVTGGGLNIPVAADSTGTLPVAINTLTTFVIACDAGIRAEAVVQVLPIIYES